MIWVKDADGRSSDCGNYKIFGVGWARGRPNVFQLQVRLSDGWYVHPETFVRQKDAKAEAERMESED